MVLRKIKKSYESIPVTEGAGVHLNRAVGFHEMSLFDPFLLLDDFRSDTPSEYEKGFPWHPHRGIETVTYLLKGRIEHGDSIGNSGIISEGDVQWMTAGSGIIHQEMPKGNDWNMMHGFQLWTNLPSSHKMMPPRYREIKNNDIKEYETNGIIVKIISGSYNDVKGPVTDIVTDPEYFDVTVPPESEFKILSKTGYTVFTYVIAGDGFFCDDNNLSGNKSLLLFHDGDHITVSTKNDSIRFLYFSGKPIGEPIAWRGPIVMNTENEIEKAYEELRNGTFIR